ncbi:MAG: hypothetical protein AAB225_09095 [Acidobacteriota bacterium]
MVDGGTNNQSYYNDINANPTVDAIEEFKVQSGAMSAEYGLTMGGVINVVTKSGTNSLHGSLYEFLRNSALDARNTFSVSKTPFTYNQFGGSVGGPVHLPRLYTGRDRTFFFSQYEEYRFRQGFSSIRTVPTQQEYAGDFSNLRDARGNLIPIFDPSTTRANPSGSGYLRDPLPGNRVPAGRFDPVSKNVIALVPGPNRVPSNPFTNADNYYQVLKIGNPMRQYMGRIDHRFSDKNNFFVRYMNFRHWNVPESGSFLPWELSGRTDNWNTRNLVISDTHTFGPRLLNDFRITLARQYFTFIHTTYGQGWPQKLGLPASVPALTRPVMSGTNIPDLDIGPSNGYRAGLTTQLAETVTYIRGRHTMKYGADIRLLQGHNINMSRPSGSFNFGGSLTTDPQRPAGTGRGLAQFLLGNVSSGSLAIYMGESTRGYSTSFFLQDDWKAGRRLNLNLGLRYDYQSAPVEQNDGNINFDPFGINPENGLPGRSVYAGQDYGRAFLKPQKKDFGPRVGFAYDPFGNASTVIRGGYAIFYEGIFHIDYFGQIQGFSSTTTNYDPPNDNPQFPAFQFRDGFPFPPTPPLGRKLGPSAFLSTGVSWDQSNERTPMSQQWSLSVQRKIKGHWLVEATYTANRGTRLSSGDYDYNQLDPQHYSYGLALQNLVPNAYQGKVPGVLGGAQVRRSQSLLPYPYIARIAVRGPHQGSAIYHALLLTIEKRLSHGFSLLASLTSGKLISDSVRIPLNWFGEQANETGYQNGKYDRRSERSTDPTDVAQRLVFSGIWELPFGSGRLVHSGNRVVNSLIGGWQMNSITTIQTGLPLIVRGASNFRANRPNSTGKSAFLENRSIDQWFDTTAFVNPPDFTLGNVGRTIPDVRAPGVINIDLSVLKDTRIRERMKLQFRAEAFNFPNHVDLGFPNASFLPGPDGLNRSSTFGTIRSARSPRIVQFGLKLIF